MSGEKEEKKFFERKNYVPKNYVELPEQQQIFNDLSKLEKELTTTQTLNKRKETLNQIKNKLAEMSERIQKSNLEKEDKEKVSNQLNNFQENIDQNISLEVLKLQFTEILNSLNTMIKKELTNLKGFIYRSNRHTNTQRSPEVQSWINESSNNFDSTIDNASKDNNLIARIAGKAMKRLNA